MPYAAIAKSLSNTNQLYWTAVLKKKRECLGLFS